MPRPLVLVLAFVGLVACAGAPAPDPVVCRDLIHRLCQAQQCAVMASQLDVPSACEATLRTRTGCQGDDFAFSVPDRERILSCRAPLVPLAAALNEAPPSCEAVGEALSTCPELVSFLRGAQ